MNCFRGGKCVKIEKLLIAFRCISVPDNHQVDGFILEFIRNEHRKVAAV